MMNEAFKKAILIENETIDIDWKKTIFANGISVRILSTGSGVNKDSIRRYVNGKQPGKQMIRRKLLVWICKHNFQVYLK